MKEDDTINSKSKKMMLWAGMISMTMTFAGLTSAYVVSSQRPDWNIEFNFPSLFYWSTVVIILSSFTFWVSKKMLRNEELQKANIMLFLTLILAVIFIILQLNGFKQIINQGYYFTGPESSISDIMDHPVIHVSWYDANAYAKWSNKRLPTESEWEWAAKGGKNNIQYPWGNSEPNRSYHKANLWQGMFPFLNENKDGSEWSSKVGAYLPNGYGLHDMAGNVWEWCLDEYDQNAYKKKLDQKKMRDAHFWKRHRNENDPNIEKVMRGGSFLCDESICSGYKLTRRMRSTPDSGFIHTGFRCVKEVG